MYTVPANARPLCDSEVPIYNLPNLNTILRLVQPADRCLIQIAPMFLVDCSTVPRQLTMTVQALLKDNGAPLMLVYRKLITTCIFVLFSVFSSMIVPRVHTDLVWLQKQ